MKKHLTLCFIALAVILQSCRKTEVVKPETGIDPVEESSGLELFKTGDSGIFRVISNYGYSAGIPGNTSKAGDTVTTKDFAGTSFQKWEITNVGGGYFTIVNRGSGKYLESYNVNGSPQLIQNDKNSSDAQLWALTPLRTKVYTAVNKASKMAITANGGTARRVILKPFGLLAAQLWTFTKLPNEVPAQTFSVAGILQNNMVIQRDKPFRVWGKATANTVVSVSASWGYSVVTGITDATGNWSVSIGKTAATVLPQTLTCSVNGQKPVVLGNILIGDVWLCSGQSNMVMPVDSTSPFFGFEGVNNYKAEIAAANFPRIRSLTVPDARSKTPLNDLAAKKAWMICEPTKTSAGRISAVAYFFARKLHLELNVPVGIVVSASSGTYAEEWTSKETLQTDPNLAYYSNINNHRATELYNGMIYPLKNLSIKGFIWYQGENNRDDQPPSNYTKLNSAMIGNWRTLFNQGQLPFYYVQMTPLAADFFNTDPWGDDPKKFDYALFREAQTNIRAVPGTGMAVTMDVGETIRIHPKNKRPVGERLALLALKNDYAKDVKSIGPQYQAYSANGKVATITYKAGTADGLTTGDGKALAQYFFVAGTDKVFREGKAVIKGGQIEVTAPSNLPLPIQAIRYAFTNFPFTNLQNAAGLPAEPFRTDNW